MKKVSVRINILLVLSLLVLSGCNSKGVPKPQVFANPDISYVECPGCPLMETEKGYYYNNFVDADYELHYLDKTTGKDVILCNKPECKHDGNEFCVGTNKKYVPFGFQLHDASIYMAAICESESTIDFKLVRIALDGSALSEVATIFSTNTAQANSPIKYVDEDSMTILNDKALFQLCLGGDDQMDDTLAYGGILYDLTTGETTFLNEDPVSRENPQMFDISSRNDCFYFVTLDGKKHLLHKYHPDTREDEILDLLMNFSGCYAVMDDGTIFYVRTMQRHVAIRRPDGTNEDLGEIFGVPIEMIPIEEDLPASFSPDWFAPSPAQMQYYYLRLLASNGTTLFVSNISSSSDWVCPNLTAEGMDALELLYDQEMIDEYKSHFAGMSEEDWKSLEIIDRTLWPTLRNPKTGETISGGVHAATRRGSLSFTQFSGSGERLSSFQSAPSPIVYHDDYKHIHGDYRFYLTSDKIYVAMEHEDLNLTNPIPSYYYTCMSIEDFMAGKDFPDAIVTMQGK